MIRHARMRGHRGALPARPRPRLDRRPVRPRRDPRAAKGRAASSLGRERYLERMRAFVATTREVMLGQQRRVGASADWGRLRFTMDEGSAKAVRVAFERLYRGGPRLPDRGARQLVPGLPDERQRPRGGRRRRRPGRSGRSATTSSTRRPASPTRTRRSRSPRPGRRRSSATPPSPSIRTTSATPRSSARLVRIPFVERDVPIIADDVVDRAFGTGRGQDHAGARRRRPRDRAAPRAARSDDPGRRRDGRRPPGRATTGSTATRRGGRSSPISSARGDLVAATPHEMVIGRCQRSDDVIEPRLKTQWFVRTGPLAARALEATRSGPDADPARAVREDLGALADRHPRLERVAPAVVGPPDPGLVLPGRPRHGVVGAGRAGRLRGVRPPGRRAPAGPGHLRHLVQLRAVAVLDPRLAGRHAGPRHLLPDLGHGDRLRHHLLLGRPDDDARARADRRGAVPHGLPVGPHPRPGRPEDVEDEGQRRRPARRHRRVRGRRAALRRHPRRDARQRPAVRDAPRLELARNFANKLWNATRFVVGRPAGGHPGRRRAATAGRRPPRAGRALAAVAGGGHHRRGRRRRWPATPSAR